MKSLFIALLLSIAPVASGSELRLDTISLPLYLHGAETDSLISIVAVPFATFHAAPEWRFSALSKPFVPPTDGAWKPHDVNVASLYGIVVSGNYKENGMDMVVTIDASKAAVPEGYPFSVEQVIIAVDTCVKLAYPPRPPDEGGLEIVITQPKPKSTKPKAKK
jgi:hypothetical protein